MIKPYSEQKMTDFGNSDKSLSAPLIHGSGAYIMQLIRQKYGTKNPVLTPFHESYNQFNFNDFNKAVMPPQASPAYNTTGLQVVMLFYGKVTISGHWHNTNEITLLRHENVNDLSSPKRIELYYRHTTANDFQMTATNDLLFNEIQFVENRQMQIIALDGFLIKLD
jgi:hypothetical protein